MSREAFTREELSEFFRALLENINGECGNVGYALDSMDVDYEGSVARSGNSPVLLADEDGVSIKFCFKPVIKMKEGEAVG